MEAERAHIEEWQSFQAQHMKQQEAVRQKYESLSEVELRLASITLATYLKLDEVVREDSF